MRTLFIGLLVLIAMFALAGCGGGGGGGSSRSNSLVAYWPANGNYDDVVGGNDGTPYGSMTFASGKYNQAFSFNGSSAIFVPDSQSLALTQSMAITAWIDPAAYPSDHAYILFRGDDRVGYDPYNLYITSSGNISFTVTDQFDDASTATSSATVPLNTWTFVACSLDNATGVMSVYINGVLSGSTTTNLRPYATLDSNANPGIGIGNTQDSSYSFYFDGLIEEIKVYNAAAPGAQAPYSS